MFFTAFWTSDLISTSSSFAQTLETKGVATRQDFGLGKQLQAHGTSVLA